MIPRTQSTFTAALMRLGLFMFPAFSVLLHCQAAYGQATDQPDAAALETVVGLDQGFALKEVPTKSPPYQPPPAPATAPAPEANWLQPWEQLKADIQKKTGTSFEIYTSLSNQVILQGPGSGNDRTVLWYNLNLNQDLWDGGQLITNTRGGEGKGLNRYIGQIPNLNANQDEAADIYIAHVYLQQNLIDDRLTLRIGKMDFAEFFDANEVGSWNYLSNNFAANPTIPYPGHAMGAMLRAQPADCLYLQAGITDAGGTVTQTAFNTAFDSAEPYLSIYEAGINTKFGGRPGTYRLLFWFDSTNGEKIDGSGDQSNDWGICLGFDQQLSDAIGTFFRYGYGNQPVQSINHYFSLGATYTGFIEGRTRDVTGLAVGCAILSQDFRDAAPGLKTTQPHIELYYKAEIRPWLSITPDLQVVINPDADPSENSAVVLGVNVELTF